MLFQDDWVFTKIVKQRTKYIGSTNFRYPLLMAPMSNIHKSIFVSLPEITLPAAYLKSCLLPPRAKREGVSDHTQAQALDIDFLDLVFVHIQSCTFTQFRCHDCQ